jgi:DNA adenine methylase
MARPFLKWAGGKSSLLKELINRVPYDYNRYFEPFLGGGALFFGLKPKKAFLSDVNEELINLYRVVKEDLDDLIGHLKNHENNLEYYMAIRNLDRSHSYEVLDLVAKASRTLYLNKTCWNGLYRVNSKGYFNVPFGERKNPNIVDEENLKACSAALKDVDIRCEGFEWVINVVGEKDFVYFDPPYYPIKKTSFTSYTKDTFLENEQEKLLNICDGINNSGAFFMLSNSDVGFIKKLYKNYNVEIVEAPRFINSDGEGRGRVKEVLISNYEFKRTGMWWDG